MQCYMVPGASGETVVITEDAYQWDISSFELQGQRERTFTISANQATISESGALPEGVASYSWTTAEFTVHNQNGSTSAFARHWAIGVEYTITETPTSGSPITSKAMIFGPKTRTLTVPGSGATRTFDNAIARVIINDDVPLAHWSVLVPGKGAVFSVDYLGCAQAGSGTLGFVDDFNHYETQCGHGNFPVKQDEAILRTNRSVTP